MMTKVFLDANIILDFLNENRKGHNTSKNILSLLTERGISIAITEDLITTVYYVTKDKQAMLKFLNFILDEWEIAAFGKDRLREAIKICLNGKNDFEDVMQSLSARDTNCTHIISNDLKFYNCGIKICTANEFLEIATD